MIKYLLKNIKSFKLWKDSIATAFVLLGIIETLMSVLSIAFDSQTKIPMRVGIVVLGYVVILIVVIIIKIYRTNTKIELSINDIKVVIKKGDIFKVGDWKLIPVNDTYICDSNMIDDIFINKNSLHGKFVLSLNKQELLELQSELKKDYNMSSEKYENSLGKIKIFRGEYMLLAFTHLNEETNEAHTTHTEYEQILRKMWKEIERTYANKPISIPLVGSGITRFDDTKISDKECLKCILCTLRTSNVTIKQQITVILTEPSLSKINLYEMKGA